MTPAIRCASVTEASSLLRPGPPLTTSSILSDSIVLILFLFAWDWNLFGTARISWTPIFTQIMPYLQIFFISAGLLFALDFGFKFSLHTYSGPKEARRGWIPILLYLIGIHVFFFWLFRG